MKGFEQRLQYARNEVARIQKLLAEAEENLDNMKEQQTKCEKATEKFKPVDYCDTASIIEQMSKIQEVNAAVVKKIDKAKNIAQAKIYEQQSDDITADMARLEGQKTAALGKSKMPIPGLSIGADGLSYNGIPVEQIADSEKLRVGIAISMALNPTLKVLRIIDGSLLDKNSMKIIADMVKADDYQVWVEQVDDTGKVGIYIEDGSVKKVNK